MLQLSRSPPPKQNNRVYGLSRGHKDDRMALLAKGEAFRRGVLLDLSVPPRPSVVPANNINTTSVTSTNSPSNLLSRRPKLSATFSTAREMMYLNADLLQGSMSRANVRVSHASLLQWPQSLLYKKTLLRRYLFLRQTHPLIYIFGLSASGLHCRKCPASQRKHEQGKTMAATQNAPRNGPIYCPYLLIADHKGEG